MKPLARPRSGLMPGILCVIAGYVAVGVAAKPSDSKRDWPFFVPRDVEPPQVTSDEWTRNGIDAFVLERLSAVGLTPAPEASRRQLIRRLYFDLIGLPPSPADVDAFLGDEADGAYVRLVDQLLQDPRYGERWARLWLDLARYADTAGYEGDPDLPHVWRYRDYVIDSFIKDKPYDVFIKEQIAGDEFSEVMGAGGLPATPPERVVALTFLRLAPFTEPRGDETRHELLSEMTTTVSSVFLGLTVGCAKCHDHKYDDIPTKDFYRMMAFFSTVSIPRPEPGDGFQIGGPINAAFYREGEEQWAAGRGNEFERGIEESKKQLSGFKEDLTKKLMTASEPVEPVDIDKVLSNTGDKRISAAERRRYRWLASREPFLQQQLKRLRPVAMSLRHSYGPPYESGVPTSRVMIRGEYDNPGEVVEAGFPSCITGNQDPAPIRLDPFKRWPTRSRRMALAQWIASSDNPLTSRVMVNRLWHWHFGRGIVATPSDFGALSNGASHPELLDWLAVQFVKHKWSIKAMHRLIVTSATYRQTSVHENAKAAEADPDNALLWRFRRRRLEAEAVRDNVLLVSGRLNPEQFGLPIFPPLPNGIEERVKYDSNKWDTQSGPEGRKRSIYIYQQRTLMMPFLQAFDSLVCDESRPRRRNSVTPLQALAMYNGDFVSSEAKHFAKRVRDQVRDDPEAQIDLAFHISLARPPSVEEAAQMTKLTAGSESPEQGLIGVCRVLLNSNEFMYVD